MDMRVLLIGALVFAGFQAGAPINTMCPVKPKQKARATIVVQYEGQVIGFC